MLKHPRFITLGGIAAFVALSLIFSVAGPIRISISVDRDGQVAAAAPQLEITATIPPASPTTTPISTATASPTDPPPATAIPSATPRPTDPPPATATLPAATPAQPRRTFDEPTPAPTKVPASTPPATPESTPDVSIEKQVDRASVNPGEQVIFTITARNSGATARDVVVTDVVPEAFSVVDLSSTKGEIVVEGQTVTAYPAVLERGEIVTIRVTAQVRDQATAGEMRNMALITTSTAGDDPGNNTSTVTVRVERPATPVKRSPPARPGRMPVTADPDAPTVLMIYGPWLGLGLLIVLFGVFTRFGLLRQRLVMVSVGAAHVRASQAATCKERAPVEGIELDPAELARRWRAGTSVASLSRELAARNPQANRLMISLAVQRLIDEQLGK